MDFSKISHQIDPEMDALERSWFEADRVAKTARAELQRAELSETAVRALAEALARLERAQRQKHEIMRQIYALEDNLIA